MTVDANAFVLGGRRGLRSRAAGARGSWAGISFIALLVALPLRGLFKATGGTMEEGFMLYFPQRMWKGDVPNVDFLHLYGPGALHVLMAWYRVFGNTLAAERTFGLIQNLGIIFALFTLARPWGRAAATAVGALAVFYVLTPIGLTAMAWNGGLALTLWAAVFVVRSHHSTSDATRRTSWAAAGLLGGLALTYRPDLVLAMGGLAMWLLWVRRDALRQPLLAVGGGAVVGLLPIWVHLAIAGPSAAWRGMFSDPVFELRAGRELPVPPSWNVPDGALQRIAESVPPWWRLPHLSAAHSIFLWFFAMLLIAAAVLAFAIWQRRSGTLDGRSTVVLIIAIVSIGILPQAMQRPDSTHLTWVTCVLWPSLIVIVADVVRRFAPTRSLRFGLTIGTAFAVTLTFALTSLFTFRYYLLHARVSVGQVPAAFPVERDGHTFWFGDYDAAQASQAALDDLGRLSKPGERLLVGPSDLSRTWYNEVIFYWMFPELEPATYFIEMDPGLANAPGSRLADDLLTADWVLLTGFWDGWEEPNSSAEFGDQRPNELLATDFCLVGEYEGRGRPDLVRLFHRGPCETST